MCLFLENIRGFICKLAKIRLFLSVELNREEDTMGNYIRFDWAMKRLLRNKANFGVLEGFLTTLLNMQVRIVQMVDTSKPIGGTPVP